MGQRRFDGPLGYAIVDSREWPCIRTTWFEGHDSETFIAVYDHIADLLEGARRNGERVVQIVDEALHLLT